MEYNKNTEIPKQSSLTFIRPDSRLRLHTTKNISPSPTLQFGGVFYIDVDQGSLINKKIEK